jgi:Ran GTPase-activating protein (RanGAP) involved in mRNA processing and transport
MGDLQHLLQKCTNLVSLRLESYWNLSNLLPTFIEENVPFLSKIELPGCQISDAFLLKLIRKVFTLRHIDVSFTNVTLSALPVVIRECLYLETLNISGVNGGETNMVADYEASEYYLVGDTLKKFKSSLTKLSVAQTPIKDDMVAYVSKHCPNIEVLSLKDCNMLTDNAVNAIAMHCPGIKTLDLGNCTNLTDIGIQSLAVHFSSHAELL